MVYGTMGPIPMGRGRIGEKKTGEALKGTQNFPADCVTQCGAPSRLAVPIELLIKKDCHA